MLREVAFISDACTLDGYLAASPGLYPALRLRFRPATLSERAGMTDRQHEHSAGEFARGAAALMAQKIVSWEVLDAASPAPQISAESVLSLHAGLFRRLYLVVLGYEASDIDPAWPVETAEEVQRTRPRALAEDRAFADVGHERREKN